MNLSIIEWIKIEICRLLIPFNLYTDVPIWKFSGIMKDEKSPPLKKYGGLLSLFELTRLMLNAKKLKNWINFNILSIKVKLFNDKTTKFLNSGNHYGYKDFLLLRVLEWPLLSSWVNAKKLKEEVEESQSNVVKL